MTEDASQFKLLTDEELSIAFQTAAAGSNEAANKFFGQFKYVFDLFSGNHSSTLNLGIGLLSKCHAIDAAAYARIHKGTPFYWIGSAAFLMQEHELAAFFFDAAVSEDLRAGAHPVTNPSPALRFILLEAEPTNQAARQLVQLAEARFQELIENYNARPGRPQVIAELTLDHIRDRLLRPALLPGHETWRSLASTLISFSLEWDFRNQLLELRPVNGTAEPFFLHLFKGCVLFESLLKCNPLRPPPARADRLSRLLREYHIELALPDHFPVGNSDLPGILADLPAADDSLQSAIRFASRLRNTVGHNLGWVVDLDANQYHRLFRMVTSSCLHTIGCLYQ